MATTVHPPTPRLDGRLDEEHLSRWLWLVKWFLAIPHYLVLAFLWLAFAVLSVVAFFAILFTGRYPRSIFDFNVGVLRWTWRVSFYAYSALGTDRYPPFSLAAEPDYPATLDIPYPGQLSRGLVLVKWLLAIPHLLLVGIFVGGGWVLWSADHEGLTFGGGLVTLLVLIAAVALLFTGRYPRQIFDLVLGLNRWVLRVAAYAALMTDAYPPFRLDMGGTDPATIRLPATQAPLVAAPEAPSTPGARRGITGGGIAMLIAGSLIGLLALGGMGAGGVAIWADATQRDASGFLMTTSHGFSTSTYALVSDPVNVHRGPDFLYSEDVLGRVKIRSTSAGPTFVGITRAADADRYLAGVASARVTDIGAHPEDYDVRPGSAPPGPPDAQHIWAAQTSGAGRQQLTWHVRTGDWAVVVMNTDGSRGVSADMAIGARLKHLGLIGGGAIVLSLALLGLAALLVVRAVPSSPSPPADPAPR